MKNGLPLQVVKIAKPNKQHSNENIQTFIKFYPPLINYPFNNQCYQFFHHLVNNLNIKQKVLLHYVVFHYHIFRLLHIATVERMSLYLLAKSKFNIKRSHYFKNSGNTYKMLI